MAMSVVMRAADPANIHSMPREDDGPLVVYRAKQHDKPRSEDPVRNVCSDERETRRKGMLCQIPGIRMGGIEVAQHLCERVSQKVSAKSGKKERASDRHAKEL